ncbi:MAG TPA: amino acid permease [Gemmatimonadaceae bacterium]
MTHTTVTVDDTYPASDRLPRQLGVASMSALLVGITIGSGIFRVPSTVAAELGSVGGAAVVWIVGAAITLAGAVPLVALTAALPRAGGAYVSLREAYGPLVAFLFGWVKLIVTGPAALAAIALIFAEYARAFTPLTDRQVQLVAGALLVVLTAANIRSVNWSAALQNVSTVAKVIVLAALSLLIFVLGDPSRGALAQHVDWSRITLHGFWTTLIVVLWTYTGWVDITYVAGEVRDPSRTYPRALLSGMALIVFVYLLVNAAYLYVLPIPAMAKSTLVAAAAAEGVLGSRGASLVAALVMVSTFGSLNGSILTSPRVFFAMADDGLFFRSVASVHPRYRTPQVALVVYLVLGLAGVATRTFEQLAELFVLGAWPFYALAVGAVFVVPRRRPELAALCRTWGHPFLPGAFLLVSAVMLANAVVQRPLEMAISVGIIALGVPVYYFWRGTYTGGVVPQPAAPVEQ